MAVKLITTYYYASIQLSNSLYYGLTISGTITGQDGSDVNVSGKVTTIDGNNYPGVQLYDSDDMAVASIYYEADVKSYVLMIGFQPTQAIKANLVQNGTTKKIIPIEYLDVSTIEEAANTIEEAANTAQNTANNALTEASSAMRVADAANASASQASTAANTAKTTANKAQSTANTAQTTANDALTKASAAQSTAKDAITKTNGGTASKPISVYRGLGVLDTCVVGEAITLGNYQKAGFVIKDGANSTNYVQLTSNEFILFDGNSSHGKMLLTNLQFVLGKDNANNKRVSIINNADNAACPEIALNNGNNLVEILADGKIELASKNSAGIYAGISIGYDENGYLTITKKPSDTVYTIIPLPTVTAENNGQFLRVVDGVWKNGDLIVNSSTPNSTKKFRISVDDEGTITATEVTT